MQLACYTLCSYKLLFTAAAPHTMFAGTKMGGTTTHLPTTTITQTSFTVGAGGVIDSGFATTSNSSAMTMSEAKVISAIGGRQGC